MAKTTIGFKGDESLVEVVNQITSKFFKSRVRDSLGRRLNKTELMSAMIYYFSQLDQSDLEDCIMKGLETGSIPYTIDPNR